MNAQTERPEVLHQRREALNSVTEQLKASTGLVGEELVKLQEHLSGKPPTGVRASDHTAQGVVASKEASAIQDSAHARGPPSQAGPGPQKSETAAKRERHDSFSH